MILFSELKLFECDLFWPQIEWLAEHTGTARLDDAPVALTRRCVGYMSLNHLVV